MSSSQIRAIEAFANLIQRNAVSHAIRSGVDLGIVDSLRTGQKTALQLAQQLNLKLDALQKLLDVLVTTELIEQYEDDYALSTVARMIPTQFSDLGDHHWQYLSNFVKNGIPLVADDEVPVTDRDFLINKASEEWTRTPAALELANVLGIGEARKDLHVLDVGCSAAVFGMTIAHRDSGARISLLDDPAGLKRAEEMVASVELEDQVEYIEGDYQELEAVDALDDRAFDLVIVACLLHRHDLKTCRSLLKQAKELLKPKGELAIVDILPAMHRQPPEDDDGLSARAIFNLEVGLRTAQGTAHDVDDLKELLSELGFGKAKLHRLPVPPFTWSLLLVNAS